MMKSTKTPVQEMGRRIRRKRQSRRTPNFIIQITALLDIMVVILVFLLQFYSTGAEPSKNINVRSDIQLPSVRTTALAQDGLRVEVGKNSVTQDGKVIAPLSSFRFNKGDLNFDYENSSTSKALMKALRQHRDREDVPNRNLWLIADRRAPHETIQTVLASAANYGFTQIYLVVKQEN